MVSFAYMKNYHLIFILLLSFVSFSGCKGLGGKYEGTEAFRSDVALFADFAIRKQAIVLKYLKYTSDDFKKDILQGSVSEAEYDDFFKSVAAMAPYLKDYEEAFSTLEKSGVLTSVNTKGILSSGKNFLSWISGSGKRSRERVLTVASNLNASDRNDLYNKLRPEWKSKSSSESDFWKKMENGDYDNQASQMFNDFQQDNTDFAITSHEKGLTIQRIIVLEGAEGVKAGGELMTDVIGTATPLGTGMDAAQVGQLTIDMYNSDSSADRVRIGSEIASNLAGMKWKDPILGIIGGDVGVDLISETISETVKTIKTDAQNVSETGNSFVVIEDEDKEEEGDIVIGQNQSHSKGASINATIGNVIDEGTKFIYTIVNKGRWIFTVIDKNGNKDTKEVDVPADEVIDITVSTTPPSDEKEQKDDYTDWNKITAQYPDLKSYPVFAGSCTVISYITYDDNPFLAPKAVIRAKNSQVEKYVNTIKAKGYTVQADGSYRGPRVGGFLRNIRFSASGITGYTDITFSGIA